MSRPLQHSVVCPFPVENDALIVGGQPIGRLALRVGQTPFYAYSRGLIAAQVARFRRHMPADVKLHYAVKANPFGPLVHYIAGLVDGFDLASGRELNLAHDVGMAPDHISFAGPGKRDGELAQAIAAGVLINIESVTELARTHAIARAHGLAARIALRINPAYEVKSSGMRMGGAPRQFGIDQEDVPAVLRIAAEMTDCLSFEGFHIFPGSQSLNAEAIIGQQAQGLALVEELAPLAPAPIKRFNMGGGFGVPYFPGDMELDIQSIGAAMTGLVARAAARLPGMELIIELGRYLVAPAGIYVMRITERKISRGEVFLVADGGMHHHLAASGNLGQLIRRNYPVLIGNRVLGETRETATVVGPLCTPLDLMADKVNLATAGPGDLVVLLQSGAYGLSASPINFLSQPAAVEALVD